MYVKIESERLRYITFHQNTLRSDQYIHLQDAIIQDTHIDPNNLGQVVILPSSVINSPRYLASYTQDAFTYIRKFGKPDLFITFTCNPNWNEITDALMPHQKQIHRHDLIARVFRQKLIKLLNAINKGIIIYLLHYPI